MKKKVVVSGIIILTLVIGIGWKTASVAKVEEDDSPSITKDNQSITLESSHINLANVKYQESEIERNESLENFIVEYLEYDHSQDGKLVYYYNNVDLNGDGVDEIFVYLMGQAVSGSGGSTALIIDKESSKVITEFTLVQNPIIISKEKTNGWNDIIMQVSGGGAEQTYAKMEYDGSSYPSNSSIAPELENEAIIEGVAIIANPISIDGGLEIR